ncbi:MAG: ddl 1 [Acidobacteria bacterium]|nr:ddl 1 [Acidobacteriota bacterium]
MKKLKVLALVHRHLVPPEDTTGLDVINAEWKMEFDVKTTLEAQGHAVKVVGVHDDLGAIRRAVDEFEPGIIFNLLEAFADVTTFDQNVVSYLELLRRAYTGCNPRGLALARDKALSKKLLAYHRVPVPDFTVVRRGRRVALPKRVHFPLIVKSLVYESSMGISQASVVDTLAQLEKRVQFVHESLGTAAIVEQFVDGRELYVGVIGNERLRAFPVWEMFFTNMPDNAHRIATERVKWNTKYQQRHGITTDLAVLPEGLGERIQHLARRAYRALDLSGYARIDLRLDGEDRPFVIEANPNPQLAYGEDFAESAEKVGVSYEALLERIMALGLQWQPERTG